MATPRKVSATVPSQVSLHVPPDKIAMRAYEKWCQRGCMHGGDEQDWLEAEAELRHELQNVTIENRRH
jgi:hypothetical protein